MANILSLEKEKTHMEVARVFPLKCTRKRQCWKWQFKRVIHTSAKYISCSQTCYY